MKSDVAGTFARAILNLIATLPETEEPESAEPVERARAIARKAAIKAAGASATLALPPGLLGLATLPLDLAAVWRIQAQMVADIAAAFGKKSYLGQEQMLYCLFRHAGAQVVRDLVVRVGQRVLIRKATLEVLQSVARRVGVRLTQRLLGRSVSRWIPVVGALGVGGYAYYDTGQVAATAIEFFQGQLDIEPETEPNRKQPKRRTRRRKARKVSATRAGRARRPRRRSARKARKTRKRP
jgi:hypothetical protein